MRPGRTRTRTIEDIPRDVKVQAVQYHPPQQWCPCCKKHVEPAVSAAMPGATLGNGVVALTTVMHYGLGLTIEQLREIFASHLRPRHEKLQHGPGTGRCFPPRELLRMHSATAINPSPTPLFAGVSVRRAVPLFRIDAGWLFIIAGLGILAATVLIPAQHDLDLATWQRDRAAAIEKHRLKRLEQYGQYLRAVQGGDESTVLSLAAIGLNKSPQDRIPLNPRPDPSNLSASVFPHLEPAPVELPPKPIVSEQSSILARWTIDEHTRLWLLAAGVLSILIGLLPASTREPIK